MSESKKIIVDMAANLSGPAVNLHMPWFSAHSEYTAGYNAGIAAAAVALRKMADGHAQCPDGRAIICAEVINEAARRVLTLMRPEGR